MSGAMVAPTIEPVAKITAELAPVKACAAASRITLARARASSAVSSPAVMSIIGSSAPAPGRARIACAHYGGSQMRDQPTPAGAGHADGAHWYVDPLSADVLCCAAVKPWSPMHAVRRPADPGRT